MAAESEIERKNKNTVARRKEVALKLEVETNGGIMQAPRSSFSWN